MKTTKSINLMAFTLVLWGYLNIDAESGAAGPTGDTRGRAGEAAATPAGRFAEDGVPEGERPVPWVR